MLNITPCLIGLSILSTGLADGVDFRASPSTIIINSVTVNGVDFRASPSTIIIGGRSPTKFLNITCISNSPRLTSIIRIEIGRKALSGNESKIMEITSTAPLKVVDTNLEHRLTASGSKRGSTRFLKMSLGNLRCEDAASYYCKTIAHDDIVSAMVEEDVNVTAVIVASPGTIEMTVIPERISYGIGEEVIFRCNGTIMNEKGDIGGLWNWQWRDTSSNNPQWTTYSDTHNIITYEANQTSDNKCQYTVGSSLTHVMTKEDKGRQFRCYFSNEIQGDKKTVYTESQELSFVTGILIGMVLMVALFVLCLIVVFSFRRKVGTCLAGTNTKRSDSTSNMKIQTIKPPARVASVQQKVSEHIYTEPEESIGYTDLQLDTRFDKIPTIYETLTS